MSNAAAAAAISFFVVVYLFCVGDSLLKLSKTQIPPSLLSEFVPTTQ